MKPLIVLLLVFLFALGFTKYFKAEHPWTLSARIAMSVMLLFTSLGHFKFDQGMALMLPDFVPYRLKIVHLTGFLEIAAAIGLLIPRFSSLTGYLLIIFFILILPANIYAAVRQVNYQLASFNGPGLNYLWFRIPLQVFFIAWVYFSTIIRYNNGGIGS